MPSPCEDSFDLRSCQGPYPVEVGITLPPGYEDRIIFPGGEGSLVRYSEVEHTLNTAYGQHPAEMVLVRTSGGQSSVRCGATQVYRASGGDPLPPLSHWLVETYVYCPVYPTGYRDRVDELAIDWVGSLTSIPLPEEQGLIAVEVMGLYGFPTTPSDVEAPVITPW